MKKNKAQPISRNTRIRIACSTCGHHFRIKLKTLRFLESCHDGFVPCEQCGSHATKWEEPFHE